jgi:Winged helix DNA-binding domain
MPSDVLSRRALNRALLSRQMLLRRSPLPEGGMRPAGRGPGERAARVVETVEHLAGLQAQAPFPPYYGLWLRLAGFRPEDLAELILGRQVVRVALMRGTIHLVSARDCLLLRPLVQPVLDRGLATGYGKQLGGLDTAELAAVGRALVEEKPRTFSELGALLAGRWPGYPPAALAQAIRALVPLVQVPPRAIWGASGPPAHTSAESWLDGRDGRDGRDAVLNASPAPDQLVIRYLAAFGPATVMDMQAWSGLTKLREVAERQRPGLRTFRNEDGGELFDLPEAPRPDPDTDAPVRLVAEFDNLPRAGQGRAL